MGLKIKPLLNKVNKNKFIQEYLKALGVEDINLYLNPDSSCLDDAKFYPNIEKAANLLFKATTDKYKIGLLVDVDCDGMCSATIIRTFLNTYYDIDPVIYIRQGKAHGLRASASEDIVEQIKADGIQLMIIPDAGTNDAPECHDLKAHGCDTLILDHHKVEVDNPDAVIVNHHLGNGLNTALSGTGVTAKFIQYYCEYYHIDAPYMNDLVAMSIFSDSCSLLPLENRCYADVGMHRVENEMIKAMLPLASRYGVNPTGYSWAMIPLINAICRQEKIDDKRRLFDAMSGHGDIDEAIKMCKAAHRLQADEVKQIMEEVEPTLDLNHKVIVGYAKPQDANLIGLVANKFMSKYHKPIILLRPMNATTWSGSFRSPVPLNEIINNSGYGRALGHDFAAGVYVKKADLPKLIDYLDTIDFPDEPEIEVTACLDASDVNVKMCQMCEDNKELYGTGVPEPTFFFQDIIYPEIVQMFKKRTTTIKVTLDGMDFLMFMANQDQIDDFTFSGPKLVDIVATLSTNTWNNVTTKQGKIKNYSLEKVKELDNVADAMNESWENDF